MNSSFIREGQIMTLARTKWSAALVLLVGLLVSAAAMAGPRARDLGFRSTARRVR